MASDNQHIRDFLTYYCLLNSSPEYAVLIKGLWGTGKSWFIQECLNELQNKGQGHLYVSLYGVTSVEDIESEFFRQLHPWLASKSVKLLGMLTKGLLKATVKVDIDSDGQSDGTLTVGVPNEKFLDSLKSAEGKVLVFDDVERCAIPICHLLGYINKFVEHGEFKVILVANENEIVEREKIDESKFSAYRRVKEKLIGKTFEIKPEIAPALSHFVVQLQCEKAKKAIDENKSLVILLYHSSSYRNLRILKHALWDFDRLFVKLPDDITNNKAFVSHFLTLFLVYSFEIMSGTICSNEISKFRSSLYFSIGVRKKEPNPYQKYLDVRTKYTGVDLYDTIFQESLWQSWFDEGFIASAEIEAAIRNSKYFQSENQPNWVRLWHGRDLPDSDFENVLEKVDSEWRAKTYTEIGVVKHVAGLLLWLSDIGLYRESKGEIFAFSKQYVDQLKQHGHLLQQNTRRLFALDTESWGGLGFHSKDDDMFKGLIKYISDKEEEAVLESYTSEAKDLLQLMKEDTNKFCRSLILCNHEDNKFSEVPILAYILPSDFVTAFLELTPDQRRTVAYVFDERYKFHGFNGKLTSEVGFLKEILLLLEKAKTQHSGKMSEHTIGLVIDEHLKKAVTKLEAPQVGG
ncbi:MAG: KAP family NTPase [Desulfobacula sp.]|nr:KAP family NTPase [Desulfobacula sp.]